MFWMANGACVTIANNMRYYRVIIDQVTSFRAWSGYCSQVINHRRRMLALGSMHIPNTVMHSEPMAYYNEGSSPCWLRQEVRKHSRVDEMKRRTCRLLFLKMNMKCTYWTPLRGPVAHNIELVGLRSLTNAHSKPRKGRKSVIMHSPAESLWEWRSCRRILLFVRRYRLRLSQMATTEMDQDPNLFQFNRQKSLSIDEASSERGDWGPEREEGSEPSSHTAERWINHGLW